MTIAAVNDRFLQAVASSNGQTNFAFDFPILSAGDLAVYLTPASGVRQALTLSTHYLVTVNGLLGGTVALRPATALNVLIGDVLTIVGSLAATRTTDYATRGAYTAGNANADLDAIMKMIQEVRRDGGRTLRQGIDDSASLIELPNLADLSGKLLGFNGSGEPIPVVGAADQVGFSAAVAAAIASAATAGQAATDANAAFAAMKLAYGSVIVEDYGAVGDSTNGTDGANDTAAIQAAINSVGARGGAIIEFRSKGYRVTDSLLVGGSSGRPAMRFRGLGGRNNASAGIGTIIYFQNAVAEKPLFKLTPQTSNCQFLDIVGLDVTPRTSAFARMSANPQTLGFVNGRTVFHRCVADSFKIGYDNANDTSNTDGTQQNNDDGVSWYDCRWVDCLIGIRNFNQQSFHMGIYNPIWESSFVGGSVGAFIDDHAGGGWSIFGGVIIGTAPVFRMSYATGSSGLWSSAHFDMVNTGIEVRQTPEAHAGVLIEETTGNADISKIAHINWSNVRVFFNPTAVDTDLIRYSGRITGTFRNVRRIGDVSKFLYIRQSPVSTRSGSAAAGFNNSMFVDEACLGIRTAKGAGNLYGSDDQQYTGKVRIKGGGSTSASGEMVVDALGFSEMRLPPMEQIGRGYSTIDRKWLTWNNDKISGTGGGISAAGIKLICPPMGRPSALVYRKAGSFATDIIWTLYFVKDNANWVNPAVFALGTDAISMAVTPTTANLLGDTAEVPCKIATDVGELKAGEAGWLEGRMYLACNVGSGVVPGSVMFAMW